jgi:hypothetical protein
MPWQHAKFSSAVAAANGYDDDRSEMSDEGDSATASSDDDHASPRILRRSLKWLSSTARKCHMKFIVETVVDDQVVVASRYLAKDEKEKEECDDVKHEGLFKRAWGCTPRLETFLSGLHCAVATDRHAAAFEGPYDIQLSKNTVLTISQNQFSISDNSGVAKRVLQVNFLESERRWEVNDNDLTELNEMFPKWFTQSTRLQMTNPKAKNIKWTIRWGPSRGVVDEKEFEAWERGRRLLKYGGGAALGVGALAVAAHGARKAGALTTVQRYVAKKRRR